jgi:hypothetical protein
MEWWCAPPCWTRSGSPQWFSTVADHCPRCSAAAAEAAAARRPRREVERRRQPLDHGIERMAPKSNLGTSEGSARADMSPDSSRAAAGTERWPGGWSSGPPAVINKEDGRQDLRRLPNAQISSAQPRMRRTARRWRAGGEHPHEKLSTFGRRWCPDGLVHGVHAPQAGWRAGGGSLAARSDRPSPGPSQPSRRALRGPPGEAAAEAISCAVTPTKQLPRRVLDGERPPGSSSCCWLASWTWPLTSVMARIIVSPRSICLTPRSGPSRSGRSAPGRLRRLGDLRGRPRSVRLTPGPRTHNRNPDPRARTCGFDSAVGANQVDLVSLS